MDEVTLKKLEYEVSEQENIGFHLCSLNWGPWYDIKHGSIVDDDLCAVGHYISQERRCLVCGKVQLRKVRT